MTTVPASLHSGVAVASWDMEEKSMASAAAAKAERIEEDDAYKEKNDCKS